MAKRTIICGVDANHYVYVHRWLAQNFGPADRCEGDDCKRISNIYEYALRKGCTYEKIRDNFMMLCRSCHHKYDFVEEKRKYLRVYTDERREKVSKSRKGKGHAEEFKNRMSLRMSGENNPMYGISIRGKEHHFYGKHHSEETKAKLSIQKAKLTQKQVEEIKELHKNGVSQAKLAASYNSSRASICRIINNKRYKSW